MHLVRLRPPLADLLLALAVTALAEVDAVAPGMFSTQLTGPHWAVAVTFAVCGLVLTWRRVLPLTVFLVVAGALVVQALVFGASEGNGTLVPCLVASYSVAAHGSRRAAYLALFLVGAVMFVRETHNPGNVDWPATRAALAWDLTLVGAWLAGSWLRARRLYEQALVERAAEAELGREQETRTALAEERARMARELHDSIAHSLTVVVVQAEAAEDALERNPELARTPLQQIGRTGREALVELRHVIGALREADGRGETAPRGPTALGGLIESARSAGLAAEMSVTGSGEHVPLAAGQAVYRVAQEALTNVLKHSESRRARVRVDYGPEWLEVDVRDDGPAAPRNGNGPGHGLVGMRERVGHLGGLLDAGPLPDGGFRVHARIPATSGNSNL